MAELNELMTIKEVAEHLRVNPRTIRRWIAQGKLTRIGLTPQTIRVPTAEVIALVSLDTPDINKCEACGDDKVRMIWHHWYNNQGKQFRKWLCVSCNSILKSNGDQIMPPWEKQLEILEDSDVYKCHVAQVKELKPLLE